MVAKTSRAKRQYAREQFIELQKLGLTTAQANHLATVSGIGNLPIVRQIAVNSRFAGQTVAQVDDLLASIADLPYPQVVSELERHSIRIGNPEGDIRKAIKGARQLLRMLEQPKQRAGFMGTNEVLKNSQTEVIQRFFSQED